MAADLNSDLTQTVLQHVRESATGMGVAVAAILLCVIAVPPAERKGALRAPLVLFAGYLVLTLLRLPLPAGTTAERALELCALFFLMLSVGRCLFTLVVDVVLGRRFARPLPRIIRDILQAVVYAGAVAIVLRQMGVEPGSLLTTSALLTAVIGLSMQETLGNLFAGLAIQAQRPFEVGDWIALDQDPRNMGRVIEINWRATTVLTLEQVELIIPNGVLAKTTIQNFTKPTKIARRTVLVQAPYEVSPRRVEEALLSATSAVSGVLTTPPPAVNTSDFADSGIVYQLNFWIEDFAMRDRVCSAVRQRIWYTFQRAGISIPFPIRTVHMHAVTPEAVAEEAKQEIARRKESLDAVDFLAKLPEASRMTLAVRSRTLQFMPGEHVIRQGDAGSELYIVRKGEVAVLVGRGQGSIAEVAKLGPGKFFGEMSLMTGERRAATVQAAGDCELVEVGKDAFHDVLAADPRLAEQITKALVERQLALEENLNARATRTQETEAKSHALLAKIRAFFAI
jgi:small-conductance mechanosensitive channel/CRP-like cAMP-binding protein